MSVESCESYVKYAFAYDPSVPVQNKRHEKNFLF